MGGGILWMTIQVGDGVGGILWVGVQVGVGVGGILFMREGKLLWKGV